MQEINERGLKLVETLEGLSLKAYLCPAGCWTIGYGSRRGVTPGMVITPEQAVVRLHADLGVAEAAVFRLVKAKLTHNAFSALVSLVFNIGSGAFSGSTLLRVLNAGDTRAAANEFLKWNRVNGIANDGLSRRRELERLLFLSPDTIGE